MLTDIRALADHFLIALPNINTRHASKVMVNSGLTAAFACTRHGKLINRGGHVRTPASVNRYKKNKKNPKPTGEPTGEPNPGRLRGSNRPRAPGHRRGRRGRHHRGSGGPCAPGHRRGRRGHVVTDPATPTCLGTGEGGGGMPSRIRPPHAPGHRRGRRGVGHRGSGRPRVLGHWRGRRGARRRGSGRPCAPGHWRGRRRGAPLRIWLPPMPGRRRERRRVPCHAAPL